MSAEPEIVATFMNVRVPRFPFLSQGRIDRINRGEYEGAEVKGALHVTRPGDRVLELGTGMGMVGSVVALNRQVARLVSFEGNPTLIPHINELYALNGLTATVEVRNQILLAAPVIPKTVPFHVHRSYLGSSLAGTEGRDREVVNIPTARFDKVKAEVRPDVLICDIEGGEADLLEHADLSGIRAIVVEMHPQYYGRPGLRHCKAKITEAGFQPIPELSNRQVWTAVRA